MKEKEASHFEPLEPAGETDSNAEGEACAGTAIPRERNFDKCDDVIDEERCSDRENTKYPSDCYSFLSLHGPFENNNFFAFGLVVWIFQVIFFLLMVLRVAGKRLSTNEDMDNPDHGFFSFFIPSNVSALSRTTQFMALLSYCFFADESLKDIVKAVETFPNVSKAKHGDRVRCMIFSCVLRFTQGILATLVVLLLVIQTQDVIDIILNFTAVNFISGFDDIAFELALLGKYGPKFKSEAKRIEDLTVPDCVFRNNDHVRYRYTIFPIATVLMIFASSIAIGQDSERIWLTKRLRVQFEDGTAFEDYSGCYELDTESARRSRKRESYRSFEANSKSARFGYCQNSRKWILYEGNGTDACDIQEYDKIAYSTKTYFFDISMSFEELWYSSSGKPLSLYFFEGERSLSEGQCGSFLGDGTCHSFFNLPEYDYDEGDCCAYTCTDAACGVETLAYIFDKDVGYGNGYPDCIDPRMKPITILLNDVFLPERLGTNLLVNDNEPKQPLMILDCDGGQNTLMVSIDGSMKNKTETVMVADGAKCIMTVKNSTIGDGGIWFVDYTVFHGDRNSIDSNPIVMLQGDSYKESITFFHRIEECFFSKLENHINKTTIYSGTDPSNQAIRWLMKDSKGFSSCERSDFVERYALSVINFAAPINTGNAASDEMITNADDQGLWITTGRHCIWQAVGCTGSVVTELNYEALGEKFVSGTIATEIGLLKNLTTVSLTLCNLSGSIPSQIGKLNALNYLGMNKNSLTGSIPTEIGALTNLRALILENNSLSGPIPSQIGDMTSLETMWMWSNYLTGSIPSEIGELSSLNSLVLDGNLLTGTIPIVMGNLNNLIYLGISYNSITGRIPSELGKITSLHDILLDENSLIGSVPSELLNKNLSNIGVYGNELSDLIPVDGEVICSASRGEHYCNCNNQCLTGVDDIDRCTCQEAQDCCTVFLEKLDECIICETGLKNPNKFVSELRTTCLEFSDSVRRDIAQFGTAESCAGAAVYGEGVGCTCNGGSQFTECVVCEFGFENPDFYVEEIQATCNDVMSVVRQDLASYGKETQCIDARMNATAVGCRCKNRTSDLGEEPGLEEYTECIICEFGFENPDFYVEEIRATCNAAMSYVRQDLASFGKETQCIDARMNITALGCSCKSRKSDLVDELDLGEEPGLEEYTECIICEFGFENPDFFLEEFQTPCIDASTYGTQNVCNETRISMISSGCKCKDYAVTPNSDGT